MLLFIIFSATLIPDEIHFPQNESFHRITMDTMMCLTNKYFGERNPIYWKPVDADRDYFKPDSFYYAVLDKHWERIVWQKCKEESEGSYMGVPMNRFGGKDHAPGMLQNPTSIAAAPGNFFVCDYGNDRVLRLSIDGDTMLLEDTYTGPYNGINLVHPIDIDAYCSHLLILDRENNRYLNLVWDCDSLQYSYNGINDSISFNDISGIAVTLIGPKIERFYVYLLAKDKIYLLKESLDPDTSFVKMKEVLHFPGADFTGIDVFGNVLLVVDNARDIILGLSKDFSRPLFAYNDTSLSSDVFNISLYENEIATFAPYLASIGIDFFTLDTTNILNDKPHSLSCEGYETKVRLSWYGDPDWSSDEYEEYVVERREEVDDFWKPVIWHYFANYGVFDVPDYQVERGKSYFYCVRAYKTDYYTAPSESVYVTVPYCNSPTNLKAVFEDSIVRLTWNDNSELNRWYYIGKEVTGKYQGSDTTLTIGYYPYKSGTLTTYIDTMPIEGTNEYRVAAIDSTGDHWYSDYKTINIPIPKASDLYVIPLPDTSANISFKYNSLIVTAGSIRRKIGGGDYNIIKWFSGDDITEYNDNNIDAQLNYVYKCHSEQKYDNIYYFWSWGENPDSVIFQWHLDTIPPEIDILGNKPDIGGIDYNLEWTASDNEDIEKQEIEFDGGIIQLNGDIREYTLPLGDYNGWYNSEITVEDYWALTSSDDKNIALFDPADKDISMYLWLENPGSRSRVYLHYTIPEAPETYTVYQRKNNNNWYVIDYYFSNTTGNKFLNKIDPGESYSAFMVKEEGDTFIHYSKKKSITNPSGGGQCPLLYVYKDTSYFFDNSLLPRCEYTPEIYEDRYILRVLPDTTEEYKFVITDNLDYAFIDKINFYTIDHPDSVEVGVSNKGKIIPYIISALPITALDNEGVEWVDSVKNVGSGCYKGIKNKNDTLYVEFNENDGDHIKTLAEPPPDDPKARLSISGDTLYNRIRGDLILSLKKGTVTYTLLDSIALIDYISIVKELPTNYIKMKKAEGKDIPEEIKNMDGVYYHIIPGDTLAFSFSKVKKEVPNDWIRDYMIEVVGYYTSGGKGEGSQKLEGVEKFIDDLRVIRSLGSSILLEIESARERFTKIRVYDIAGRIVKSEALKLSRGINSYSIENLPSGIYFIRTSHIKDKTHKVTVIR